MASYQIEVRRSALKDIKGLGAVDVGRVRAAILILASDPFPRGVRKLTNSDRQYRIRAGPLRVIYEVNQPERKVTVQYVRHRRDAYRRK